MHALGTVGLGNVNSMKFKNADHWEQIHEHEVDDGLDRVP